MTPTSRFLLLVGLTLTVVIERGYAEFWDTVLPDFSNPWKRLNVYLIDLEQSDSIEANFKAAEKLMAQLSESKKKADKKLVAVVEMFLKLKEIGDGNKCNLKSYSALNELNLASKGMGLVIKRPIYRLDKIIYDINLLHAYECRRYYIDEYDKMLKDGIEGVLTEEVGDFLARVVELRTRHNFVSQWKAIKQIGRTSGSRTPLEIKALYYALWMSLQGDKDRKYLEPNVDEKNGKIVVSDKMIEAFLSEFVVKPCDDYIGKTAHLFMPAWQDYELLSMRKELPLAGLKERRFYSGFALYRMCNYYTEDYRKYIEKLTSYIYKSIPLRADQQQWLLSQESKKYQKQ